MNDRLRPVAVTWQLPCRGREDNSHRRTRIWRLFVSSNRATARRWIVVSLCSTSPRVAPLYWCKPVNKRHAHEPDAAACAKAVRLDRPLQERLGAPLSTDLLPSSDVYQLPVVGGGSGPGPQTKFSMDWLRSTPGTLAIKYSSAWQSRRLSKTSTTSNGPMAPAPRRLSCRHLQCATLPNSGRPSWVPLSFKFLRSFPISLCHAGQIGRLGDRGRGRSHLARK